MLYTVGHSTRDLDEFLDLLSQHGIEQVVDVRRLPGSSRYPHFNEDHLAESLQQHDIRLLRLEELTGRRKVSKTVPFEVNAWWENRSFHNYADHALSTGFHEALSQLLEWADEHSSAIMCAEAVWWRCHRRIISDWTLAAGIPVTHILDADQTKPAELSAGAVVDDDHRVTYPADSIPPKW